MLAVVVIGFLKIEQMFIYITVQYIFYEIY